MSTASERSPLATDLQVPQASLSDGRGAEVTVPSTQRKSGGTIPASDLQRRGTGRPTLAVTASSPSVQGAPPGGPRSPRRDSNEMGDGDHHALLLGTDGIPLDQRVRSDDVHRAGLGATAFTLAASATLTTVYGSDGRAVTVGSIALTCAVLSIIFNVAALALRTDGVRKDGESDDDLRTRVGKRRAREKILAYLSAGFAAAAGAMTATVATLPGAADTPPEAPPGNATVASAE
jgi:hypothetical protein